MNVIGIDAMRQMEILQLVAAILHIGNIGFVEKKNFAAIVDERCKCYMLIIINRLIKKK